MLYTLLISEVTYLVITGDHVVSANEAHLVSRYNLPFADVQVGDTIEHDWVHGTYTLRRPGQEPVIVDGPVTV